MMKKLKGALSHSPKLGGRKLSAKSTSMMNLGPQQSLSIADPDLRKSNESLSSQTSDKKKMSAVEKLKHKLGKSPMVSRKELSKANSRSCSNLLQPEMKLSDVHSSNESLKSSKSNKSASKTLKGLFSKKSTKAEKPIPAQFDLSKPSNHLLQEMTKDSDIFGAVPFNAQDDKTNAVSASSSNSPKLNPNSTSPPHTRGLVDDSPFQRRQNSLSTRKRPDLSHRSPAVIHRSPMLAQREPVKLSSGSNSPQQQSSKRNVFNINADIDEDFEAGLWSNFETESSKQPTSTPVAEEEKKEPTAEVQRANSPAKEIRQESTNPFDEVDIEQPAAIPDKPVSKPAPQGITATVDNTMILDTPSQKKKILAPFVFSPSDDEDDVKHVPEISGVSPRDGSTEGGTHVTIRGDYLGKSKKDIIALSVCGVDCLRSLEYFSEYKISCVTGSRKPGSGKIVIETKSGGLARSTIDYIFTQPRPAQDEKPQKATATVQSMQKMAAPSPKPDKRKAPTPPKEITSHQGRGDNIDTKTAVVEPISRAKMTHSRNDSGDLKRKAPPRQIINKEVSTGCLGENQDLNN